MTCRRCCCIAALRLKSMAIFRAPALVDGYFMMAGVSGVPHRPGRGVRDAFQTHAVARARGEKSALPVCLQVMLTMPAKSPVLVEGVFVPSTDLQRSLCLSGQLLRWSLLLHRKWARRRTWSTSSASCTRAASTSSDVSSSTCGARCRHAQRCEALKLLQRLAWCCTLRDTDPCQTPAVLQHDAGQHDT